jgi:hypothetical protein
MSCVEDPTPEKLRGLDYALELFDSNAPRLPNGEFVVLRPVIGTGGSGDD